MSQDDSGPEAFLARMSALLDIADETTTEFDLVEIPFHHIQLEASVYGGNWTFRVGHGEDTAPTFESRQSLADALREQRTKPVNLGLYVSQYEIGAPTVAYL